MSAADNVMEAHDLRAAQFTGLLWLLFKRLNDEGIFAEQFVACCNTCGWDDLMERFEAMYPELTAEEIERDFDGEDPSDFIVGFAYTHEQNRDEVEKRAEVHIGYGSREECPTTGEEVAALIVKVAKTVPGLRAEWDGSIDSKVRVYLAARDGAK